VIVIVVDASNLQRNLYYATQVVELGHPTIIALNMVDVAEANGHRIDDTKLAEALGVPVLPVVATTGQGVPELRAKVFAMIQNATEVKPQLFCQLPGLFRIEATGLADLLAATFKERRLQATAEALLILSNEKALASSSSHYPPKIQEAVAAARRRLEAARIDWRAAPIEWRYARVAEIQNSATTEIAAAAEPLSDKLDRVLTHKVWGTLIFVALTWGVAVFLAINKVASAYLAVLVTVSILVVPRALLRRGRAVLAARVFVAGGALCATILVLLGGEKNVASLGQLTAAVITGSPSTSPSHRKRCAATSPGSITPIGESIGAVATAISCVVRRSGSSWKPSSSATMCTD